MDDISRTIEPTPTEDSERAPSRASRLASFLIVLACLAGLAALGWYFAHRNAAQGGPPGARGRNRPTATVGFAAASRADIPIQLEALGTVTPLAMVTVRPQVSGVIKQIYYQEGQMIERGQPLVQIDPQPFQLALDQAIAQEERDAAQLDNARVILERDRGLLAEDSIAKQDVETQDATVKQLMGAAAADRSAVASARLNLTYSRVLAPITGRVGLRPVDLGNYVATGDAAGVATITQLRPIDVMFTLPADTVVDIQRRASTGATLTTTALDRTRTRTLATGQFLTLDNQIDVQTGTIRAKARFENTDGTLFPNQFVNVRLQTDTLRNALVVPAAAIRHGPQGDFVYVVAADNTAHLRNVQVGPPLADRTAILSGLTDGERVVTEGGDRLTDGGKVRLPGQRSGLMANATRGGQGTDSNGERPRQGGEGKHRWHKRPENAQ